MAGSPDDASGAGKCDGPRQHRVTGRVALLALGVALAAAGLGFTLTTGRVPGEPVPRPSMPATATDLTVGPAYNSPHIEVDPTNDHFVAMADRRDSPDFSCALQLSGDGARTWLSTHDIVKLPAGVDKCYAPEVAFGPTGRLYYLFVGLAGNGNLPVGAFLTTSDDRGRTFRVPRQILGPGEFGVRMAIDRSRGREGRIHLVWLHASGPTPLGGLPSTRNPILTAHSDDGGETFSAPQDLGPAARRFLVAPSLQLGPHHAVHVAFFDLQADARDYFGLEGPAWDGNWSVLVTSSFDAGEHFGPARVVDDGVVAPERVMLIFTMPAPAMAAWSNHLCVGWADARYGDSDILLRCALLPRLAWRPPVRVNDDRRGNGHRQFLPALSAAPDGRLDAAYLDRPDPLGVTNRTRYASSFDAGHTFRATVALAEEPSSGAIGARYAGPAAADQVEFGSRLGLVARNSGALVSWPDTRNSTRTTDQDLFTTEVTYDAPASPAKPVVQYGAAATLILLSGLEGRRLYRRRWQQAANPDPLPGKEASSDFQQPDVVATDPTKK